MQWSEVKSSILWIDVFFNVFGKSFNNVQMTIALAAVDVIELLSPTRVTVFRGV